MRESRTSGSVRGDRGNPVPYRYSMTIASSTTKPTAIVSAISDRLSRL
jgi:hypothetical protein